MNCKHCGTVIADGAKFCVNCGNKVEIEEANVADTIKAEAFAEPERVEAEVVSEGIKASQPEESAGYATGDAGPAERVSDSSASESASAVTATERVTDAAPKGPIGYSIASLVCGILGLLCCCCGFFGLIVSAAGIVFGIVSLKKDCEGRGMAIAGIICGGIGALMTLGAMIVSAATGSLSGLKNIDDIEHLGDSINDLLESL